MDATSRTCDTVNWKKPGFWGILVLVFVCVYFAAVRVVIPRTLDADLSEFIRQEIFRANESQSVEPQIQTTDYKILGLKRKDDVITVYMWVLYQEYRFDGELHLHCGSHIPTILSAKQTDCGYELTEYWIPRDGAHYTKDINKKFPFYLRSAAKNSQRYIERQRETCEQQAIELVGY